MPLCVVSSIILSACSSTPHTTKSSPTSHRTHAHTPALASTHGLGGLDSILTTPEPTIEAPYSVDTGTVWPDIREAFQLDWQQEHPAIAKELNWYRDNPAFLYRATERSSRYLYHVMSELRRNDLPAELALLPIVESAYDPFAYSRSGAAGMWQFVPATGTVFGLRRSWWYDGRKDVVDSTAAAVAYLKHLHRLFNGDWLLAVAAYNYGEGSIQRAVAENRRLGRPTDFWSLQLRDETRTYVPRLLALAKIVNSPHKYGINLYAVPNRPYFAAVDTGGQIELARAAELAGVDPQEIYLLNPGFSHWATDPQGPQRLLVPVAAADRFRQQLAQLPMSERGIVKRYDVAKGDTLASIGRKFGVDPAAIRNSNQLKDGLLHPGQSLVIPSGPSATVASAGKAAVPQTKSGANQVLHTVVAGDNLRRIAQQYGVSTQEIQRWNGLPDGAIIKLGQRLSIWTTAPVAPAAVATANTGSPRKVGYTIQNGDSLTAIANRFNVQIDDILRWNTVNSRALLQPGQKLTLYTRQ